jgi:hypothetical protein
MATPRGLMLSGDGGAGIALQGKGVAADNTDTKHRKVGRAFHGHRIPPSNRLAQVSESIMTTQQRKTFCV